MFTDNEGQLYNPVNKLQDLILFSQNTITALKNLEKDDCRDNLPIFEQKLQYVIDSIENLKNSSSILDRLQSVSETVHKIKDNLILAQENLQKGKTDSSQKEIVDLTADEPETVGENDEESDVKEIELIEEQREPVSYVTYRRKNQVVKILLQYMKEDRLLKFQYRGKQKKGFVLDIWNTKNSSKLVASFLHFDDETNAKYWRTYCVAFIEPIIRGPRCFGCVSNQKDRKAHVGEDGCMSE